MDLRLDSCKGMKRMRLSSGEVVDSACARHPPGDDDECRLGLNIIGHGDLHAGFASSRPGPPACITAQASSSSSIVDLSCSPFAPSNVCDRNRIGLCMSYSGKEINSKKSGTSRSQEPDPITSSQVELNLGLTIMPAASAADSALTSILPSSFSHLNASDQLNSAHAALSLPSFCQEGSPICAQNSDLPMIDEGSTSNGCLVLPFLGDPQLYKAPCPEARRFDSSFTTIQDDSDISMSFKAISGTTSTSGTSSGSGFVGDRAPKLCRFTGCGKRARGASGLCISHGGGRRCQRTDCNKGAEGSTIFCKAHGGGRRCDYLGCTKSAEGKTDFCIAHGGGSRCFFEGCPKAARGRTGYCIRHGGGKRCQREGCTKSAEGYSALCIAHGGGKRCQYPNCGKGAQGSTMFCKGHGGGKRCTVEGCNKGAEGSTPLCKGHGGGKRCMFDGGGVCSKSVHGGTLFCVAHGGGKRCIVEGCTKSARGRTDCCVKHGGGKRCKFENCDKSAQGSTDFCKAHGGGKRCSWGQESFAAANSKVVGDLMDFFNGTCDKTAKGKLGLCAEHSALVQDRRVHGIGTFAGNLLSQNETRNKSMPGFAGSNCGGERNLERGSSLKSLESNEKLRQSLGGMQGSTWHISESQFSSQGQGRQANRINAAHVPPYSITHMPSTKPVNGTQHPNWAPYLGVSSMHWQSNGKEHHAHGQGGTSSMDDDEVFNMSSLSLPEERVHGGNMLALLSGGGGGNIA